MTNYTDLFMLKGKKALVIGAAGLIGREIAVALAQAGAQVIAADVDEIKGKQLEQQFACGGEISFRLMNVTDLDRLESSIKTLVKELGRLDIFVNTAYPRTKDWGSSVEEVNVDTWRENVDMQLNSYALSAHFAAQQMRPHGGSIVLLGSIYGMVGGQPAMYAESGMKQFSPIYAAVKGGIVNLSRYYAAYFGKDNIRVNTICPGGIFDGHSDAFTKAYGSRTPLGRMGKPQEIASAVLFLASEASSYVTGTALMVDGGWTAV